MWKSLGHHVVTLEANKSSYTLSPMVLPVFPMTLSNPELSMGWVDPYVGFGWVGLCRVGSRFFSFWWVGMGPLQQKY